MNQNDPTSQVAVAWVRAQPTVASYINSMVQDFHATEDILQKVALKAVKHYDRYDPERPFIAWALGIARHEVLHYQRSQSRDKMVFSPELMESLSDSFENHSEKAKEIRGAIGECVGKMTDRSKKIFWLRYGKDLSVKSMAKKLDMKPNTVSVSLHKCRLALRECLSKRLGHELWR